MIWLLQALAVYLLAAAASVAILCSLIVAGRRWSGRPAGRERLQMPRK